MYTHAALAKCTKSANLHALSPYNSQTPVNEHFPLGQSCSSTKCRVCLLKGQWEGLELMVTLVEESL
jgi:hypothetical protein